MTKIDWDSHRERVYQVCAEEIIREGMSGYIQRSVDRLAKFIPAVTHTKLRLFLQRDDEWPHIRKAARKGQGSVVIETTKVDPLPADHPDLRAAERKTEDLRSQLRDIRSKLREADKRANIASRVEGVLRETVRSWEPHLIEEKQFADREWNVDGVLLLSDEHADLQVQPEVVMGLEDYGFSIFRERLSRLARTMTAFTEHHLPQYRYDRLFVLKLGDSVQGNIHNMKHRNEWKNSLKAAVATGDVEADFIYQLTPFFPGGVHVVSIPGNHGRTTQRKEDEDPHDSFDFVVSSMMAARLSKLIDTGEVTIHVPRSWSALVDVRGWTIAMNHGDNVRGYAGFPWYGYDRYEGRVKALHNRYLENPIDYFVYGHYHTPTERTTADSRSVHNGAFYMTDPFAHHQLAVGNAPEQEFLTFMDREDDRGYVFKVPIYLRNRDKERLVREGKREPELGRESLLEEITDEVVSGVVPIYKAGNGE